MAEHITKEQVQAEMGRVMIAAGVLTPKNGMARMAASTFGGSQYEVHPEKVTPQLLNEMEKNKILGDRDAKTAMGKDMLFGWGADDVRGLAEGVGKAVTKLANAPAQPVVAQAANTTAPQ